MGRQDSKLEIARRVREDRLNSLEMGTVDSRTKLCMTKVNADKSHTTRHLTPTKHKKKVAVKGRKLL